MTPDSLPVDAHAKISSTLDPEFVPAALWNRAFRKKVSTGSVQRTIDIAITRDDDTVFRWDAKILDVAADDLNFRYVERSIKFLLWQKGGNRIVVTGAPEIAAKLAATYAKGGAREFDWDFIGKNLYGSPIEVVAVADASELPAANDGTIELGRHLKGCRIGFDLGGSDRKCAAVIDGEVVFSEEVVWDPYFQSDPAYHLEQIDDSLKRAAAHLPRVDAIGGSAAGVYVNNEVRAASLFRGISKEDFDKHIRRIFFTLRKRWNDVPFEVVNDGEVTALAGSMSLQSNRVLGIAMGTSEAAGYVDVNGLIKPWLDELAFAPVDYRKNGPVDEWSGDAGCGVQYFSQQAVARLAPAAGYDFGDMPFPEQLVQVQQAMANGEDGARQIYETLGIYLGYSTAHYADFYDIAKLMVLGRVSSGPGGDLMIKKAREVLALEFPELDIDFVVPDEKMKRHGQAVAAASLADAPA